MFSHPLVQVDTRNDTAIAKVLQAEEEAKAGLPLAPPSSSSSQDACDRTLALVMQEEYDAEIASHMQHEEREKAGGGSHGERWPKTAFIFIDDLEKSKFRFMDSWVGL